MSPAIRWAYLYFLRAFLETLLHPLLSLTDLDWIRVSRKARFRRAVSLEDKDGPKTDDKEAYSDEVLHTPC